MADDTHKKAGLTSSAMRLYFLSMSLIPHTFALTWMFWCSIAAVCLAQEGYSPSAPQPRTLVVALDGSGQYSSIQAAIDDAGKGDTVRIKAGAYREDVTIHSKERLRLVGEGIDKVSILGRERVGVFHIGKWPYGAEDIQISGLTIHEHGGHAMGMFNGRTVVLREVRIKGMVFGQQVQDVLIENCAIGGSETTGVQFADSQAVLIGNFIHDNDHGVTVAGTSKVHLERNVITRSLFEGVVVTDRAQAIVVSNTIVNNGGGIAFLGTSQSEVTGNIIGLNKVGFLIAPSSRAKLSYNALHNSEGDYFRVGNPNKSAPELRAESDLTIDPGFVDASHGDFRLRPDTPLQGIGDFLFLGALPPTTDFPLHSEQKKLN